jgi:hypothetical protein
VKPDSFQTYQQKTDRPPDSRLSLNADPTIKASLSYLHFLLPESPPSDLNFNFNFCRITRTAHSSSQAWLAVATIIGIYRWTVHIFPLYTKLYDRTWKVAINTPEQCMWPEVGLYQINGNVSQLTVLSTVVTIRSMYLVTIRSMYLLRPSVTLQFWAQSIISFCSIKRFGFLMETSWVFFEVQRYFLSTD